MPQADPTHLNWPPAWPPRVCSLPTPTWALSPPSTQAQPQLGICSALQLQASDMPITLGPRPGTAPGGLCNQGCQSGQPSRAPGQTLRPGQVQTACLVPRYGRVRVGRLPTAPSQQTIVPTLLRRAQAAGWELGTSREGLPLLPPGNGQWEPWRLDMEIPDASSQTGK